MFRLKQRAIISLIATTFILLSVTFSFAEKIKYTYDDLNRLHIVQYLNVDETVKQTIQYDYDEVGNRTRLAVSQGSSAPSALSPRYRKGNAMPQISGNLDNSAINETGDIAKENKAYVISGPSALNSGNLNTNESLNASAQTDPLDVWKLKVKATDAMSVQYSVAYGNKVFVSVGMKGVILSSANGSTWTRRKSGTTADLFGVSFINSMFFAVGDKGTILSSFDGKTWEKKTSGVSGELNMVTYGKDKYVAVGDSILVSADGNTWTAVDNTGFGQLFGVAFGEDKFIAVGFSGASHLVLSSSDGLTWTATEMNDGFMSVLYAQGKFVMAGVSSVPDNSGKYVYGVIYSSEDGVTWTDRTEGQISVIYGLAYGDNTFLAVGKEGTLLTSPEGDAWTKRDLTITPAGAPWFLSAAYGDGIYVASSNNGIYQAGSSSGGGLTSIPKILLSAQKLDLGLTIVGAPVTGNITITNTGQAGLLISRISFIEDGDFSVSYDCAGLAPSETCPVTVTFSPLADSKVGKKTQYLFIVSDDPKTAVSVVTIKGTVVAPRIAAKPSSVNAGTVKVGSSVLRTIKISNTGHATLSVSSVTISGTNAAEFSQTNDCGAVAPKGTCLISVTFTAASAGPKTATLTVSSNDPQKAELEVNLTGKGK